MNLIKIFYSWITNGKLVWLEDYDGEVTLSIARKTPWNKLIAKRYWPSGIRFVVLLDDGNVENSYVKKWKKYKFYWE